MPSSALPHLLPSRADLVRTWLRAAVVGSTSLVLYFAGYELVERVYMRGRLPTETLFALHMIRGISASILVGTISVAVVWVVRGRYERAFAEAHRRLEEAMERRIAESEQLQAYLRHQEKMAAIGVLSAGIAHDIANPLASMSSELEMLEDETDLSRVKASVAELRRLTSRIERILREMTAFARRRGDETIELPMRTAVDDALRMVRHDPRARKVQFEIEVPADLPKVRAVEDHLVMVFVNLLINAFDAMPEGGTVRIVGNTLGGNIQVQVMDTGTGMTPDVLARAREPMFTTKERGRGTGLGLSVSNGIIESAGGALEIGSELGKGTCVTITLPTVANVQLKPATEKREGNHV
ncbi:MAG: hypothetical protein IPK82_24975 [Polyangiaceae bacterium]|nr:hypothetical protein [Polyangiaceae bacterium]